MDVDDDALAGAAATATAVAAVDGSYCYTKQAGKYDFGTD